MNAHRREMPSDLPAERALLGCLLLEPDAIGDVVGVVSATDFYRPDHGMLYALLVEMHGRAEQIDAVTVGGRVIGSGDAEAYGGYGYVLGLPEQVPSRANVAHYAATVRDRSDRRKILRACHDTEALYDVGRPVLEIALALTSRISDVGEGAGADDWQVLDDAIDDAERELKSPDAGGIPVSLRSVARIVPRWKRQSLTIVMGRPGMGKTALVMSGVMDAVNHGEASAIFPLEMSPAQMAKRAMQHEGGADGGKMLHRQMDPRDWSDWGRVAEDLRGSPVYLARRSVLTVTQVCAQTRQLARRMRAEGRHLGLVVVDYLQLIDLSDTERGMSESSKYGHVSRCLKLLAKELDCCVMLLSQMNRDCEKRADKRPMASDIRASGNVEQDADEVIGLFREAVYDETARADRAEVLILKHRGGELGCAEVGWDGPRTRFFNLGDDQRALVRM